MNRVEVEVVLKNNKAKNNEERYISVKEVYLMSDIKYLSKCIRLYHKDNGVKDYIGYTIKSIKDCDFNLESCCLYLDKNQELLVDIIKEEDLCI